MPDRLPDPLPTLQSADSVESADAPKENQAPSFEQHYLTPKQKVEQSKAEEEERNNAELELDRKLVNLGALLGDTKPHDDTKLVNVDHIEVDKEVYPEEEIKALKNELVAAGKTPVAILQEFLSRFVDNPDMALWVENWKNFLRLHELAATKSPKEKKAIEKIIFAADFGSTEAFSEALDEVKSSDDVSTKTKLEISQTFGGSQVSSIKDMDRGLQKIKSQQKELTKSLTVKNQEIESTKTEIKQLQKELDTLPLGDPKIEELEAKIDIKEMNLNKAKAEAKTLSDAISDDVSYSLREGITARLNEDGSRSIIIEHDITIRLPNHTRLFSNMKNLRAINLAFPYRIMKSLGAANIFFGSLRHDKTPHTEQRYMGHFILSALGFNDRRILKQSEIEQLQIDLSRLLTYQPYKSVKENLHDLGIYDIHTKKLDKDALLDKLKEVRESRGNAEKIIS